MVCSYSIGTSSAGNSNRGGFSEHFGEDKRGVDWINCVATGAVERCESRNRPSKRSSTFDALLCVFFAFP